MNRVGGEYAESDARSTGYRSRNRLWYREGMARDALIGGTVIPIRPFLQLFNPRGGWDIASAVVIKLLVDNVLVGEVLWIEHKDWVNMPRLCYKPIRMRQQF